MLILWSQPHPRCSCGDSALPRTAGPLGLPCPSQQSPGSLEGKGPDGPWTSASASCTREAGEPSSFPCEGLWVPPNPTSLLFLSVLCAGPGWPCPTRDKALLVCVVLGPAGAPSPGSLVPTDLQNQNPSSHRVPWIKGTLAFEKLLTFQGLTALLVNSQNFGVQRTPEAPYPVSE